MRDLFTFIDLFAGIGGIRIAMERCQGRCVFSCEWDKYAQITYKANFDEFPAGDITTINEQDIPTHDVLTAGFPCQPFSIAGVSKKNSLGRATGFLDKTQGTLFFDVARIIKAGRPKAFLLENVKNLVSHDKGKTFSVIRAVLQELDYEIFWKVLDARHYLPQHRERVFIVGFDKQRFGNEISFDFPEPPENNVMKLGDILDDNVPEKYILSDKLWTYLQNYAAKHKAKGNGFGYGLADLSGVSRTLSARYYKDGSEILIPREEGNPRRLTPRECSYLMGYPKDYKIPVSDTRAYKQFGNSVAIPVVEAVGQSMIDTLIQLEKQIKEQLVS